MRLIAWSVRGRDGVRMRAGGRRARVLAAARPGAIVLLHEGRPRSNETILRVVDALLERGFPSSSQPTRSSADAVIYWLFRHLIRASFSGPCACRRAWPRARPRGTAAICWRAATSAISIPFASARSGRARSAGWRASNSTGARWSARAMRLAACISRASPGRPGERDSRSACAARAAARWSGFFLRARSWSGAPPSLRGGPIKRGVCLLAAHSGKPVLPCLVLGTEKLNRAGPWLPVWRGRLWIAAGDFIPPVTGPDRRAARAEMAESSNGPSCSSMRKRGCDGSCRTRSCHECALLPRGARDRDAGLPDRLASAHAASGACETRRRLAARGKSRKPL